MRSCPQVVNICVWVLASAFGVPAMVLGNVEEEQEHNSEYMFTHTRTKNLTAHVLYRNMHFTCGCDFMNFLFEYVKFSSLLGGPVQKYRERESSNQTYSICNHLTTLRVQFWKKIDSRL